MPRRKDIPPEGARMLATALAQVRRTYTGILRDLELDWPGSRALLVRLGVALAAQNPQKARSACANASAPVSMPIAPRARRAPAINDASRPLYEVCAVFASGDLIVMRSANEPSFIHTSRVLRQS